MAPTLVLSAPDGPHIGPMNLAIRECWPRSLVHQWVIQHATVNERQLRHTRWFIYFLLHQDFWYFIHTRSDKNVFWTSNVLFNIRYSPHSTLSYIYNLTFFSNDEKISHSLKGAHWEMSQVFFIHSFSNAERSTRRFPDHVTYQLLLPCRCWYCPWLSHIAWHTSHKITWNI